MQGREKGQRGAEARWSVIDTGLRDADENMALDHALVAAVAEGGCSPIFRFLHFRDCALLGHHQSPQQELDLAFCAAEGVAVQRRLTGGGAIIFDPTQLGWELVCRREDLPAGDMSFLAQEICEAAALGLRQLGVDAQFRPRNDIEVGGRKVSGTGGIIDGKVVLFQGTVLIDLDIPRMLRILRVPAEKLNAHAIQSVAERVTSLRALLGRLPAKEEVKSALLQGFRDYFSWDLQEAPLPVQVESHLAEALATVRDPEWLQLQDRPQSEQPFLQAVHRGTGGTLRSELLWDARGRRIRQIAFSGDFFIQPRRAVIDLEAALRNSHIDDLPQIVERWYQDTSVDALGLVPQDFVTVVLEALPCA
ncbi:lipoate--protein ligase family protein [Acidithiobacillus acidisediminis]|uniref:lipoate--protein ligase family protein n=1 Tax=Acidithiobacillus TaxID=119977 RepID=UPI0020106B14|nr:lipoate--protein ligase family protein [Acidithiobacillus sp. S30A2]